MLFLAVTGGFFVENLREHHLEKEHAEEFAKNLIGDLMKDTADFNEAIASKQRNVHGIDTLIHVMNQPHYKGQVKDFMRLFGYVKNNYYITRYDATSQQLTFSGSLRYFGDMKLYSRLTSYYAQIRKYNDLNNLIYLRIPFIDGLSGIFDFRDPGDNYHHDRLATDKTEWLSDHSASLNRMITYSWMVQHMYAGQSNDIVKLRHQAIELILEIKKEYDLD